MINNKQFFLFSKIPCRCILEKKGMLCLTSWIQVALKDCPSPAIKALHNLCDDLPIRLFGLSGGLQETKNISGLGEEWEDWKLGKTKSAPYPPKMQNLQYFTYGRVFRTVVSKGTNSLFVNGVFFSTWNERLSRCDEVNGWPSEALQSVRIVRSWPYPVGCTTSQTKTKPF